jgi:hypothetical protein
MTTTSVIVWPSPAVTPAPGSPHLKLSELAATPEIIGEARVSDLSGPEQGITITETSRQDGKVNAGWATLPLVRLCVCVCVLPHDL